MSLISKKDIAKLLHVEKLSFIGLGIGWLFLRITRLSKVNKVYDQVKHLEGEAFFDTLLSLLKLKYQLSDTDLQHIPKEGPFITVSNHPLGGVDGIILLQILTKIRPDYKITGNFLLKRIKPIAPFVISVNPFEDKNGKLKGMGAAQLSIKHLKNGGALGFFPAGEVSTQKQDQIYIDKEWSKGVARIAKNTGVPVIPIYFHTKNTRFFYILSKISGLLRTMKLPSEVFNKDRKTIKIRIGESISQKTLHDYESLKDLTDFLRKKTYILANSYNPKENIIKSFKKNIQINHKPKLIDKPQDLNLIIKEINSLRESEKCLTNVKDYEVFFASAKEIPIIIQEIGRLRETTFREIGEGTNKRTDLDKYDKFYHHLFLWDKKAQRIAGAYRMGLGHEIYPKYGTKGFYVTSLFEFDSELHTMLSESIEMGRAFIIKEYQQRPMPLFLLWKGVIHVTLRNPQNKFLIGGVSISNQFSNFSKSLMIEYMKSHFYDPFIAQYIHPRKEYKVKLKIEDRDFVFNHTNNDLRELDKFIKEIEPKGLRIPVLIKKYVKQNVKLVAFNVDPKFNNAIDGLMYIRISDLPEKTVKPVLEEYQEELVKNMQENK